MASSTWTPASVCWSAPRTLALRKNDAIRGHGFLDGQFALDDNWRLTLAGAIASDDSYLETFNIDDADTLRSTDQYGRLLRSLICRGRRICGSGPARKRRPEYNTDCAANSARLLYRRTRAPWICLCRGRRPRPDPEHRHGQPKRLCQCRLARALYDAGRATD